MDKMIIVVFVLMSVQTFASDLVGYNSESPAVSDLVGYREQSPTQQILAKSEQTKGHIANAASYAVLSSKFTGTSKKTGHIFTIEQNPNGKWNVKEFLGCQSYPCSTDDRTISTQYVPLMLTPTPQADGNIEIGLGTDFKIIFVNDGRSPPNADGSRPQSYWELEVMQPGSAEEIILNFIPVLTSH